MANNILTIADGDYGYPTSTIATLVQGQYGQSLPLEIRDLAGNVVNLTGFSTLSAIKSSERGRVTSIVGTIALSGTPTVAPQLSWILDEADTGIAGTFSLVLSISNGTITHETHPVELVILPNPAINAVAAPGVVGITTAQRTLLSAIQGLTGLVKMAAGTATGIAVQSFMETFLASATAVAARLNLLPSYTGNTGKVLAVNGAETDVEWVAQSGGGASDVTDLTTTTGLPAQRLRVAGAGGLEYRTTEQDLADLQDAGALATTDIGVIVQGYSAKTAAIAALTWAANSIILLTGTATASVQALAAHVVTFLQSANAADARTAIGAGTGNGDVTASSNVTDNAIVTGDGGAKGVQGNVGAVSINDSGRINTTDIMFGGDTSARLYRVSASRVEAAGNFGVTGFFYVGDDQVMAKSGTTLNIAAGYALANFPIPTSAIANNATTNAITNVLTLGHNTTGTPAAGLGAAVNFTLETSTTVDTKAGRVAVLWETVTHASRVPDMVAYLTDSAAEREIWRGRANGSAAAIGFLGATPVARAAHIADASGDDAATVNAILVVLENLGFIATS